jgi:hypothetical protein
MDLFSTSQALMPPGLVTSLISMALAELNQNTRMKRPKTILSREARMG